MPQEGSIRTILGFNFYLENIFIVVVTIKAYEHVVFQVPLVLVLDRTLKFNRNLLVLDAIKPCRYVPAEASD